MTQEIQTDDVVAGRTKRLEWAVVFIGLVAAALLVTLALPWKIVTVADSTMNINGSAVAINGGVVSVPGREAGALQPILVAVGLGAAAALAAWKKWWWASAAVVVILVREGLTVPMPGARGAYSLAEPGTGLDLARVLWPALIVSIALASLQAFLVRQAEKAPEEEEAPSPVTATLGRVLGAAFAAARNAQASNPAPAGQSGRQPHPGDSQAQAPAGHTGPSGTPGASAPSP